MVRYDGSLIFYFDIDGPNKGQNKVGVDIFDFQFWYAENSNRGTNRNNMPHNNEPEELDETGQQWQDYIDL